MSDKKNFKDVELCDVDKRNIKRCFFTPEFWDNFNKNNWEKNEFVLNDKTVVTPISESEFFDIVVGMSERQIKAFERDGEPCNGARMYIGNEEEELYAGYFHLYPKKEDKNFKTYSDRVERELEGGEFSFVVDQIEMSPHMKAWTKEFLKGMYKPLKGIAFGNFWSVFYGNYSATTYGVHDHSEHSVAESAFYFPIKGNKKMRTWHPSYVNQHEELKGSHDYSKHKDASVLLSADPGGVMYWPSDRWHIGSSAGGDVSVVLAVKSFTNPYFKFFELMEDGFFDQYFCSSWLEIKWLTLKVYARCYMVNLLNSARQNQVKTLPFDPDDLQGSAVNLPLEVREIGKSCAFIFKDNLERVLSIFWLIHLSTLGIDTIINKLPTIKPVLTSLIERCPGTIILWRQIDTKSILVVSDTFFHELPLGLLPLVKYVVSTEEGDTLIYGDLVELVQRTTSENFDRELSDFFSFLVECTGFVKSS